MALEVSEGDCVHFQWTGSDANPIESRGYGRSMTDRTNLVELEKMDANVPARHSYDEVTGLAGVECRAGARASFVTGLGMQKCARICACTARSACDACVVCRQLVPPVLLRLRPW